MTEPDQNRCDGCSQDIGANQGGYCDQCSHELGQRVEDPADEHMVTEPGLYDMPADQYHAHHDWLSVSGAKKLIPPSCPAKFKAALGVEDHKPHFDLGKAAHTRVLGVGEEVVIVEAAEWRSKDAREQRDAAYAAGKVPILAADNAAIDDMAAALAAHPIAPLLFATGKAEQSAFWIDDETGVQCRARFDWLPEKQEGRRLIIPDLKTAASAEPGEFSRNAARFHYVMQDRHYRDAAVALDLGRDPAFLFVVIEKEAPYCVTVGQFDDPADQQLGDDLNRVARKTFRQCMETDTWPSYTDGIASLSLPAWHHYAYEELTA